MPFCQAPGSWAPVPEAEQAETGSWPVARNQLGHVPGATLQPCFPHKRLDPGAPVAATWSLGCPDPGSRLRSETVTFSLSVAWRDFGLTPHNFLKMPLPLVVRTDLLL